ncbi:MAG: thioredoxin domain-containing protein [Planctomycetes bacterium]|nr:thioredoxin domain-containing protein [Planctomycetota bacterium]
MKPFLAIITVTLMLLVATQPAHAKSTKEEVIELKAQVAEMQKDLAEIKVLLRQRPLAPSPSARESAFQPQTISLGNSPVKGDENAPVTIIEYSDYQCPFCARNFREVLPIIQSEYIDTGKVRFVMRENPLANLHKDATNASMAALCAHDQGEYWAMHDIMFQNPKQLGVDNLKEYATQVGLDSAAFNECLDSQKHAKTVRSDMASGTKLGVRGTPAFVIGLTQQDDPDKVDARLFIKGAQGIDQFRASIDDLLESSE